MKAPNDFTDMNIEKRLSYGKQVMEHEAAKYAEVSGSFAYWTSTKSTNMCKERPKPLFGSLNVLFGAVQVAIQPS